eukprot:12457049-Alexandrium_andersonii.AAC.2
MSPAIGPTAGRRAGRVKSASSVSSSGGTSAGSTAAATPQRWRASLPGRSGSWACIASPWATAKNAPPSQAVALP